MAIANDYSRTLTEEIASDSTSDQLDPDLLRRLYALMLKCRMVIRRRGEDRASRSVYYGFCEARYAVIATISASVSLATGSFINCVQGPFRAPV